MDLEIHIKLNTQQMGNYLFKSLLRERKETETIKTIMKQRAKEIATSESIYGDHRGIANGPYDTM